MKILAYLLIILLISPILSQTTLPSPGITPDNPLYGFKRFFERVSLFFTFGNLAKARRHVELASLRLSEANAMIEKNKTEHVIELLEEYEDNINKSHEISEIARGLGENISSVYELVAAATSQHLAVLERVYEKAPDQAKPAILRAINVSANGAAQALESLNMTHPARASEIERGMPEEIKELVKEAKVANLTITRIRERIEERKIEKLRERTYCTPESRLAEACITLYSPVCGSDEITYSNSCFACINKEVEWYVPGECSIGKEEEIKIEEEVVAGKGIIVKILEFLGISETVP